jgi:beta-phosphoglucomutase-like phosphatase (HAD superfamily)
LAAYIESLHMAPAERQAFAADIEAIHRAKTRIYTGMVLAGEVPLRDGVARLLDEATRAGVALSIASTTSFPNIEALLRTTLGPDALDRFAVIGAGDQVPHKKPAPDIFNRVLRELDIPADECVAIEDSANGLHAAKAAGLYTVVTPSYWTAGEDFSAADLVLPSLGSPERPLPARAAALLGNSQVGIRDLDRHIHAPSLRLATR